MNYLAHAYLSFGHPEVLVGNMISDFVKGKARFQYPPAIQAGIMLHRAIDTFTDTHAATKRAMEVFRPHYRLYSGAIVDILYDHFIANDPALFTYESLFYFSDNVYTTLEEAAPHLPPVFAHMMVYMRSENWLWNYRTREGMQKSLKGLVRRAAYMHESEPAYRLFIEHYSLLQECYFAFIKDMENFAKSKFDEWIPSQP